MASRAVAAAASAGSWGSRSKIFSLFCRGICVTTGFGIAYAFANPDEDTVYEMFPLQQQHQYALLNFFSVEPSNAHQFEEKIKDLSRFYQKQQGYLFTRVLRGDQLDSSSINNNSGANSSIPYQYVHITTWLKPEDYRLAADKPTAQRLTAALPSRAFPDPILYQNVADDSRYSPIANAVAVAPVAAVAAGPPAAAAAVLSAAYAQLPPYPAGSRP